MVKQGLAYGRSQQVGLLSQRQKSKETGQQPIKSLIITPARQLDDFEAVGQLLVGHQCPLRISRPGADQWQLDVIGEKSETTQTVRLVPTPIDYWIATTYPRERAYRAWRLRQNTEEPLLACYEDLARRFPQGLAELPELPEEVAGTVHRTTGVGV